MKKCLNFNEVGDLLLPKFFVNLHLTVTVVWNIPFSCTTVMTNVLNNVRLIIQTQKLCFSLKTSDTNCKNLPCLQNYVPFQDGHRSVAIATPYHFYIFLKNNVCSIHMQKVRKIKHHIWKL